MINIISVGKKHQAWIEPGLERYTKRLRRPYDVTWQLVPSSPLQGDQARQDESDQLLRRLKGASYIILLDETGQLMDSPTLARNLSQRHDYGTPVTIVIGGAYGVDERVRQRAEMVWSLSPLVLPHQLVRLVLIEQIYRSQQIGTGSSYHHA